MRHLAHLGRSVRVGTLLPGLLAQARAGALADGVGVGWYPAPEFGRSGSAPLRYRRAGTPWTDAGLTALGRTVDSGCVLACVRSAPGSPADESACPPLLLGGPDGGVLLSHDGDVPDVAVALGRLVPSGALAAVGSTTPSAFVAALVAARLAAGDALPTALGAAVQLVAGRVPTAGLGLLATDGSSLAGVAWGAPLAWRAAEGAVVVASAPTDTGVGWEAVPDRSLVSATLDGVEVCPL